MNARTRQALKYVFSILLMLVFLILSFKDADFPNLWRILSNANYWWIAVVVPILIFSHMLRAWRWKYLIRPVKDEVRFYNLFSALMIGYMTNNVLPRAGELARPYAIHKLEGISFATVLGTVFLERLLDVLFFVCAIGVLPLVYSGPLQQVSPWLRNTTRNIAIGLTGASVLLVILLVRSESAKRYLRLLSKRCFSRLAQRIDPMMDSFRHGLDSLNDPGTCFVVGILSAMIWGLYVLMVYLSFYAFGLTEHYSLTVGSAIVVQAISSIGIVVPTPGSTGSYHFFAIQALTKLYSVDGELARSYATVTHAVSFFTVTLIGLYYFYEFETRGITRLNRMPL
jgi:uncharacterized protein (TIRG00374 family)